MKVVNKSTDVKAEWYKVKVYFDGFTHEDEIKGINEVDAFANACWNWKDAERIELIK